jgi:hypothetical protein
MSAPLPDSPAGTIAYLTPWYLDGGPGPEAELSSLAARLREAAGDAHIAVIAFGPAGRRRELAPGVALVVLPASSRDALSWDLPAALAGAGLVHLHEPFSRAGEMGLLLARLAGTPVCASHAGGPGKGLGDALDLLTLADRVVAPDEPAARLGEVYRELLARAQRAAA